VDRDSPEARLEQVFVVGAKVFGDEGEEADIGGVLMRSPGVGFSSSTRSA
jgi:hypothetical protein